MPLSVVAIVGRPNVGKSSLFNCLAGRRIAIVDPTAGVTRDRVSTFVEAEDRYFELVDTGGMGIEDSDNLTREVEEQISRAVAEAALVVAVVDVRAGLQMLDKLVADRLRRAAKPVVLAANKADGTKLDAEAAAFWPLGLGEPLPVSAKTGRNRRELLARLLAALPPEGSRERPPQADMTLAIVGKRNAGKSTFINSLAQEQRVIVSEVPGTTRDSIDIRVQKDSLVYVLIDTAGIRKRQKVRGNIEFYSRVRAEAAIRRADATLLMIDALLPVSTVDKHLGRFLVEARKPVVLLVNKWDLAKGRATTGEFADYLTRQLPGLEYAPISFISALESRNVEQALDVARGLFKQAHARVATAEINRAIEEAVRKYKPPAGRGGKLVKLYYGTQVAVDPPTVALFVNSPQNVSEDYARYLSNRFRARLPFAEVPLRLLFRQSGGPPPEARDKPRRPERRRAKRL